MILKKGRASQRASKTPKAKTQIHSQKRVKKGSFESRAKGRKVGVLFAGESTYLPEHLKEKEKPLSDCIFI